jgi:hypothetical protein
MICGQQEINLCILSGELLPKARQRQLTSRRYKTSSENMFDLCIFIF